jgi:hypothetical protein
MIDSKVRLGLVGGSGILGLGVGGFLGRLGGYGVGMAAEVQVAQLEALLLHHAQHL